MPRVHQILGDPETCLGLLELDKDPQGACDFPHPLQLFQPFLICAIGG